jgi:hypothetical protein
VCICARETEIVREGDGERETGCVCGCVMYETALEAVCGSVLDVGSLSST